MATQIRRISVHQTSKVFAIMYFVIFLLFLPIGLAVYALAPPPQRNFGMFFLVAPFLYAILGYLGVALFAALYNVIAPRVGGIEFELGDRSGAA